MSSPASSETPSVHLWIDLRPLEEFLSGQRVIGSHPFPARSLQTRANELPPKDAALLHLIVSTGTSQQEPSSSPPPKSKEGAQVEAEVAAIAYLQKGRWPLGTIVTLGDLKNNRSGDGLLHSCPFQVSPGSICTRILQLVAGTLPLSCWTGLTK